MGSEISSPKNRAVSPCDGSLPIRNRNNYHPLKFHHIHGENIKLNKNKTVASRHEGFCKAIVFSDRPVLVREPVCIRFLNVSSNWSGALRIGFTMHDPVTLKSKLPKYTCPDLTSMPGNWGKAIAERLAKTGSVLYYYVDQNGDVHYGIDTEEHGVFFSGVNTSGKLWAVLDIYGNTTSVELVDPSSVRESSNEIERNLISVPANDESPGSDFVTPTAFITFSLVHGRNVGLSRNRYGAYRKKNTSDLAYVFTDSSLLLGDKIRIKVMNVEEQCNSPMFYGITSCNPSSLLPSCLPENVDDLLDRPEYWVVREDTNSYQFNDVIEFTISGEGEAVVTKNEQMQSVFYVDVSQPLWFFINLTGKISEVFLCGSIPCEDDLTLARQMEALTLSQTLTTSNTQAAPGPSNQQTFTECVICYEERVNCALYRCGHMCMCYECAHQMWKPESNVQCPICRETIQDIIKIYI